MPLPPILESEIGHVPERDDRGDWRWQLRNAIRDLEGLERAFVLTAEERDGARRALAGGFPLSITPYYASLADPRDPSCPIRLQCVPRAAESRQVPGDRVDPLGEVAHEVAPRLVRRYPDRVLLLVTDRCSVYCRFCTRSRMVGRGGGTASVDVLEPALGWIAAHPEIRDVIVSGGDPGLLSDARITELLERLRRIEHVDTVRFATRVPVTLPQRVTPGFAEALRVHPSVWVMTHFNHPKELTDEARAAIGRLVDAGLPVMNQTVLLRGVNDDADVIEALCRGLVRARARPYYLLQADPVRGSAHLRTPLHRGIALITALQGRLSGIAMPRFVVDAPGGHGKVTVGPDWKAGERPGVTTIRTPRGTLVDYVDPPRD
ncbi:MAG: KamA family radical SAM protein [Myxococcota bacterium]|nr:KamA family radical SAM protein [Myxococcota bacterium]MDW8362767.1 KamA family radical SAM protein [Myxococcales bacterium]